MLDGWDMNNGGNKMAFAFSVLVVAAAHFVVSFFAAFAAGISEGWLLKAVANVLTFPLPLLPKEVELPGLLNWLPWAALSFCWGMGLCSLLRAQTGNVR